MYNCLGLILFLWCWSPIRTFVCLASGCSTACVHASFEAGRERVGVGWSHPLGSHAPCGEDPGAAGVARGKRRSEVRPRRPRRLGNGVFCCYRGL